MDPINTFAGKVVAIPAENIDTDQIIPARFLKVTTKEGLGDGLFETWRYNADGTPNPDFVLNRPESAGATVLVAGKNFGSGSSREHAPWALQAYGFQAVISPSFADIFKSNSLKIGLLPIVVDEDTYYQLVSLCEEDPQTTLTVDLAAQTVTLPGGQQVGFPIDGFSKHCLLNGVDQLGFIQQQEADIAAFEATNPVASLRG
ncbi:3-isopropylmalate dehydratase small subunit [Oscillochloris sp. ZM17-4]|uniref:3-isopropylmalate dehydratase small subunit n=1 Tax=Oscillochloris sp. ZM17-4 TaxID=2866714 RepID=UPI001C72D4FA|nr:3-isopropylmalate dehydratase small subunit [Oscillochloris sp. ZM17-4]MBX0327452.1 3-isopropylmalate dehydratase small subunit [Oscillochloris sp. ZM17-4]